MNNDIYNKSVILTVGEIARIANKSYMYVWGEIQKLQVPVVKEEPKPKKKRVYKRKKKTKK